VSMGSVAASGGYWISMSADEIWASPNTLTGSIGVGFELPTFQRTLAELGIFIDGVGTTALSGQFDITRELSEEVRGVLELEVARVYNDFVGRVAEHRGRPFEEIERAARGRVWVGSQAKELGLVDELGELEDAIRSAAEMVGLAEGEYRLEYLERPMGLAERFALQMARVSGPVIKGLGLDARWPRGLAELIEAASEPLAFLERMNDPRGIYAYCVCDVR
jgi:protease IV